MPPPQLINEHMNTETIFWMGAAIALIWWLFFSGSEKPKQETIKRSRNATSSIPKEVRPRRQPQNKLTIDKPIDFQITEEIKEVLETLENTNRNIFLTGKAGTGKSTLLRHFRATTKKSPVVIAPTGVAAVNVQGQTIHSFFGWGITITPERVRKVSYQKAQIYRKMKMLIIDEISMVRADIFDCIDRFLRLNTGNPDQPFGGVQLVVIGDLYQLPPVVKGEEKKLFETKYLSPFFFSTEGFEKGAFKKFELNNVFRQSDEKFISALNAIREGCATTEHIELINGSVIHDEPEDFDSYVHLVTTNMMAKDINDVKMERLPASPLTYTGTLFGTFKEKDAPTEIELTLKAGAQVMLLNNDKSGRWVNGDVVNVTKTNPTSIEVEFDDGSFDIIEQFTWETVRFIFDEEEQKIVPTIVGSFTQIPAKPAWAMTIHKAQGKTFAKLFVDLGSGAFAEGQTYVALSRCKTLEGLKLASPIAADDIFINQQVRDFMSFNRPSTSADAANSGRVRPPENLELNLGGGGPIAAIANDQRSQEDFVLASIRRLRKKGYKGIHVVYSGFNDEFRKKFNQDPVQFINDLEKKGVVRTHLVRGGVMLYDAKDRN
jgi:ATP-dependent DNA helicase PIF1